MGKMVDNADGQAPQGQIESFLALLSAINGSGQLDRLKTLVDNADSQAAAVTGLLGVVARVMYLNQAGTWIRPQADAGNADSFNSALIGLHVNSRNQGFNGATWDRLRTPLVFKNLSAVVITGETTIWTPTAGKKFRLMGFLLAQGVATGAVTLKDNTAGTTIFTIPAHTIGVVIPPPNLGNGILSAAANNVLTATGASTETLTGVVFGTEE